MGKYFGTDGFRGEAGITLTADHADCWDLYSLRFNTLQNPTQFQRCNLVWGCIFFIVINCGGEG